MRRSGVLLYVPWTFDMLGGVDVAVSRLREGLECYTSRAAYIGVQQWGSPEPDRKLNSEAFAYLNLPAPPSDNSPLGWVRYGFSAIRHGAKSLRLLRSLQIGIVNAHYPTLNLFPIAIARKFGLWRGKLMLSFHGSDVSQIDIKDWRWRLIATQTDVCTACSDWLAEQVRGLTLFTSQSIVTIHNGVDIVAFQSLSKAPSCVASGQRYILNVGSFIERKGQDLLLKAFSNIADCYPDVELVLAGGRDNGSWLSLLHETASRLGIEGRVRFFVDVEHSAIPRLMQGAECLVHTAHQEPFGLVLIEAGAVAVPVIATSVGGALEVIRDPTHGRLVPANDVDALSQSIELLLDNGALRREMGKRLQHRVEEQFSLYAMVHHFEALFKEGIRYRTQEPPVA